MMFKSAFFRIVVFAKFGIQVLLVVGLFASAIYIPGRAEIGSQRDIVGPLGSVDFGRSVSILPNGNIVVGDPQYVYGPTGQVGAVYLYDGNTLELISMLKGSHPGDLIGSGIDDSGIGVLPGGDFLVLSPFWNNATGALTWCSGTTGCNGEVSASNSLVGTQGGDLVGVTSICNAWECDNKENIYFLPNGNYIVGSPYWHKEGIPYVGAVSLCNGTSGCVGKISPFNSLVGKSENDLVGIDPMFITPTGDYIISTQNWDNDGAENAGAFTWCSGVYGCLGEVNAETSLVGTHAYDAVGQYESLRILSNGAYLVISPYWDNGVITDTGAVTWCDGVSLCVGAVSPENSLVGTHSGDIQLSTWFYGDGYYGQSNPLWDNGNIQDAGAVTWCNNQTGCVGEISDANSLIGTQPGDQVGMEVALLSNGNYVVSSPMWNNGPIPHAGAVNWCSGSGCKGAVTITNSLHGSHPFDNIGEVHAFTGGNYLVSSPSWDHGGIADTGVVMWCDGIVGCFGEINLANSLVGTHPEDQVGMHVNLLLDGQIDADQRIGDNKIRTDSQYTALCGLECGTSVTIAPSVFESTLDTELNEPEEMVYEMGIEPLSPDTAFDLRDLNGCKAPFYCDRVELLEDELDETGQVRGGNEALSDNGTYVVSSPYWDNGTISDVGAVTWCEQLGCAGEITVTTSLIGSISGNRVGSGGVSVFENGTYVVSSPSWESGVITDTGALTWCFVPNGCTGAVSSENSLIGSHTDDFAYVEIGMFQDGNFWVRPPYWDFGFTQDAGAVTWCEKTGCTGMISDTNSLVGSYSGSLIGASRVDEYENGYFIVASSFWAGWVITITGAITFCSTTSGCSGIISPANSLVGGDPFYHGVRMLQNGNFLVASPGWDNGMIPNAGAVTLCAPTDCFGEISSANSLVGTHPSDSVGEVVVELKNHNILVVSANWDGEDAENVGAVTWCEASGCTGEVSELNSLIGSHPYDTCWICGGVNYVHILDNGNYVVETPDWDNEDIENAGAITWCSAVSGCKGKISEANSLVGSQAGDYVGEGVYFLENDTYVVLSIWWDNGSIVDAGAVTWCSGTQGCTGPITPENSIIGQHTPSASNYLYVVNQYGRLIVSRPMDNTVTIVSWTNRVFVPLIKK